MFVIQDIFFNGLVAFFRR